MASRILMDIKTFYVFQADIIKKSLGFGVY